jgi:hypothetical protein
VVLSVVVLMGAGVCYRTRVYQQRRGMQTLAGGAIHVGTRASALAPDWGPKPTLFDLYVQAPREKPESDWDEMMVRVLPVPFYDIAHSFLP